MKLKAVDHRGRRVRFATPTELEEAGIDPSVLGGSEPGWVASRRRGGMPRPHWTFVVSFAAVLVFGVLAIQFATQRGMGGFWTTFAVGAGCMWLGGFVLNRILRDAWWRSIADRHVNDLIKLGACPGCGFRIDDLEPQADDCVVCPECGAAWRASLLRGEAVRRRELAAEGEATIA